jgi:hypothetical protein
MNRIKRRERLLMGVLVVVIMIGALALIRSQPWGRLDLRPIKPNTPDWIVCVRLNEDAHGDLMAIKPDGQTLMLTEDDHDDRSPDWAPDGKKIVFSSNRRDGVFQLWTIDPDGKGLAQLTLGGGAKLAPVYDRDGQQILHVAQGLVTEIDPKGVHALQLIPSASQMIQVREQYGQVAFRYAKRPDPNLIAAVQRIDEGEQVVLQDLTLAQQQFTLPVVIAGEQVDIDWAPQGKSLVVSGAGLIVPLPDGERRVGGLIRFDFGATTREVQPRPLWFSPDASEAAIEVALVARRLARGVRAVRAGQRRRTQARRAGDRARNGWSADDYRRGRGLPPALGARRAAARVRDGRAGQPPDLYRAHRRLGTDPAHPIRRPHHPALVAREVNRVSGTL